MTKRISSGFMAVVLLAWVTYLFFAVAGCSDVNDCCGDCVGECGVDCCLDGCGEDCDCSECEGGVCRPQGDGEALDGYEAAPFFFTVNAGRDTVPATRGPTRVNNPNGIVLVDGCTGVVVDADGTILTAKHCDIRDGSPVSVPGDPRTFPAEVLHVSDGGDGVVALRAEGVRWTHSWPISEHGVATGDRVQAYGFAEGRRLTWEHGHVTDDNAEVSLGGRPYGALTASTGALPGMSGGPLLNEAGEVVGLCSAGEPGKDSIYVDLGTIRETYQVARRRRGPPSVDPSRVVYVATRALCDPCRVLKRDVQAGYFSSYEFRFVDARAYQQVTGRWPAGFPEVACNGLIYQGGYRTSDGRNEANYGRLVQFLRSASRPPVDDEVIINGTPGSSGSDLPGQVAQLRQDVRAFREAGVLGKVRMIGTLRDDVDGVKGSLSAVRADVAETRRKIGEAIASARGFVRQHEWFYGLPLFVIGWCKRRFLNF